MCEYVKGDLPVPIDDPNIRLKSSDFLIHKRDSWAVFLSSSDQRYLGRCVIILKRHSPSLSDLTEDEWLQLHSLIRDLEKTAGQAFGATHFNWTCLMNNSYQQVPANPHVHLHFRPRYRQKVEFHGMSFVDEDFGHHYNRERQRPTPETATAIASALRDVLKNLGDHR